LPRVTSGHNLIIMTKLIIWRKCLLCRRSCFDGLVVRGRLLCPACERRLVRLSADEPDYDTSDRGAALAKAEEWGERIPTGILYQSHRPVFEEQFPALAKGTLVGRSGRADLRRAMERFR